MNIDQLEVTIDRVTNERIEYDSSKDTYKLDVNHDGSEITVFTLNEDSQTTYEQGVDYELVDAGSDGLFEEIKWLDVTEPNDGQDFYIDYTVFQDVSDVSEEEHTFVNPQTDTITFDNNVVEYKLSQIPTKSTVSIEDEKSTSYAKDSDYEIVNTSIGTDENDLVFSSGRTLYELNNSVFPDSVTVSTDSLTFIQGTDYRVIDNDGDGIEETIEFLEGGDRPSNGQEFTTTFDINNGLEQTIRWLSSGSSPSVGDDFTVSYEQQVYNLDNEIDVVTPDNVSCNCPTGEYSLGSDFKFVDVNADTEKDAIYWVDGGENPSDGVSFFVSYQSEGDITVTEQEKIDASTVTITKR